MALQHARALVHQSPVHRRTHCRRRRRERVPSSCRGNGSPMPVFGIQEGSMGNDQDDNFRDLFEAVAERENLKYNPIGESRLREIFLKTDNFIQGRYLAKLTREVMTDLEQSKYQNCVWRISIYGRALDEWDKLAKWVINNKLFSHNVRWLIQVQRLYEVYKANGSVDTFEDIVVNKDKTRK
ncbi:hypothetical protein D9615_002104 [Tricholomella constricta]|uniref:Uncharacterized protein n=1 Tax=Tricholomella constricta TaxID=117010 RepID=A0A8H5HP98_9AGAR|nr:hypothetical protein D9615_002104 [Tricholomella constricta]